LILIDTNIFLEVLLGRSKAEQCKTLLDMASEGKIESAVTHFSVHSVEAIMRSKGSELTSFLRTLDQTTGLYVFDTTLSDEVSVSILSGSTKLDFDDAIQYFAAKALGASSIISFDKDFDGLDIPRLEPREVLSEDRA
jgi:predicted nucleic acid-binding protein